MNTASLKSAVDIIKTRYNSSKVYLFGSQGNDTAKPDSDIDLCILINKPEKRTLEISRDIRRDIYPILKQPLDILVYDQDIFLDRAALSLTLESEILQSAVEL